MAGYFLNMPYKAVVERMIGECKENRSGVERLTTACINFTETVVELGSLLDVFLQLVGARTHQLPYA